MAPFVLPESAAPGIFTPSRLCSVFVDALHVTGASISVIGRDGRQSTISATDAVAARGQALQLELGEGPHWDALAMGSPVISADISTGLDQRWPVFAAAAEKIGIGAVFAFPMKLGAATVGVVDLYSSTARWLDSHQISLASSMANRAAAPAVREAARSADEAGAEPELTPALRREVHQATGMIQAQLHVSATEAFTRLRARAFSVGRPLVDVAREVVSRRIDFSTITDSSRR